MRVQFYLLKKADTLTLDILLLKNSSLADFTFVVFKLGFHVNFRFYTARRIEFLQVGYNKSRQAFSSAFFQREGPTELIKTRHVASTLSSPIYRDQLPWKGVDSIFAFPPTDVEILDSTLQSSWTRRNISRETPSGRLTRPLTLKKRTRKVK